MTSSFTSTSEAASQQGTNSSGWQREMGETLNICQLNIFICFRVALSVLG